MKPSTSSTSRLLIAAAAAFATYFCMYAFRKPFTAATFEGQEIWGAQLKGVLIISQIAGYMLSKFIGIKVISEMRSDRRAATIVGLILAAEAALVGFAFVPVPLKVLMLFLNGIPLGMVFGLVMGYLEGRRQTEALTAVLCASFIISSGVVKSVGRWLVVDLGVNEYWMPMLTGAMFFLPLLGAVFVLQATPPPDEVDRRHRNERKAMDRSKRYSFLFAYWPGLLLLVLVYLALTVVRTMRDDFGVEIWRGLGVDHTPSIYAQSEMIVAVCVTALSAMFIWITPNLTALRVTFGLMLGAFAMVGGAATLLRFDLVSPLVFMVACGVGLYVPYVAFHTTVFERFIAVAKRPCNIGFLMYLADALGYLGYAIVIGLRTAFGSSQPILPYFSGLLLVATAASIVALLLAMAYFSKFFVNPGGEVPLLRAGAIEEIAAAK